MEKLHGKRLEFVNHLFRVGDSVQKFNSRDQAVFDSCWQFKVPPDGTVKNSADDIQVLQMSCS